MSEVILLSKKNKRMLIMLRKGAGDLDGVCFDLLFSLFNAEFNLNEILFQYAFNTKIKSKYHLKLRFSIKHSEFRGKNKPVKTMR